ncbi:hypothetical protein ACFQU2_36990 [Siccirubricoccus deserti]
MIGFRPSQPGRRIPQPPDPGRRSDPEDEAQGVLGRALKVAFLVPGLTAGGHMKIGGKLFLAASGPHLAIAGHSRIRPEAMRGLRSQLEHPGDPATDGDDNLVWPWGDDWQQLLGLQLRNLRQGIAALIAALAEAAETKPHLLRGAIRVQQCEVCRDFAVADAERLARQLAEQPIQDAGTQIIRPGPRHVGNSVCVAWHEGYANSPERKAYGKRHDLLRTEVSLRKRTAVNALLTRAGIRHPASPELTGDAVASALSDVAAAAAPCSTTCKTWCGKWPTRHDEADTNRTRLGATCSLGGAGGAASGHCWPAHWA